jgi:hypothetical protein
MTENFNLSNNEDDVQKFLCLLAYGFEGLIRKCEAAAQPESAAGSIFGAASGCKSLPIREKHLIRNTGC